jgi:hypothetical protein
MWRWLPLIAIGCSGATLTAVPPAAAPLALVEGTP